jgi:predicted acyltransferase (DUF342 family)
MVENSLCSYDNVKELGNVKWDKNTKTFEIKGQTFTLEEALAVTDMILYFVTGKSFEASEYLSDEELADKNLLAEHINKRFDKCWQN